MEKRSQNRSGAVGSDESVQLTPELRLTAVSMTQLSPCKGGGRGWGWGVGGGLELLAGFIYVRYGIVIPSCVTSVYGLCLLNLCEGNER